MSAIRIVVDDVDESIAAYEVCGFTLAQRWGPPFAVLANGDIELWISGDGTSAVKLMSSLSAEQVVRARVRPVQEVDDLDAAEATLLADGWSRVAGPINGRGGSQILVERGSAFLEVFATR